MSSNKILRQFALPLASAFVVCVMPVAAQAANCPAGVLATPKTNNLYLYYAPSDDAAFPNWFTSGGMATSPLKAFDFASHDPAIGTFAQLRQRVQERLQEGYCEFDVKIQTTTSTPAPTEARWQIIGIGSDTTTDGSMGVAQDVDIGDADAQDYARFWVGEYQGWLGGEITGTNSTLERWATALADLIGHESGHNYGLAHGDATSVPGEDAAINHFIANPALGASPDSMVDALNHFGDTEYELLGANIGLNIKTLHNWDFTNPNASNADSLVITVLSDAAALTIGWWFNGSTSPWSNPTVASAGSTQVFRGTTYNVFRVTFSTAKAWSGGVAGTVPPGVTFHTGASFAEPNPVIVTDATLRNGGTNLALHPRIVAYDAGFGSPVYNVSFFNTQPEAGELIVRDLDVVYSPRMIDIETMVRGGRLRGMNGLRAAVYQRKGGSDQRIMSRERLRAATFTVGREALVIPIALLTDERHVDHTYTEKDCETRGAKRRTGGANFGPPGTVLYCPKGTSLSLFPATYVYVSATVIDPNAERWDAKRKAVVRGPSESRVFFQVAGVKPDFNRNGTDDLLDIRTKKSRDANRDGIPDDAKEPRPRVNRN
jgi:hypothetical protein